MPHPNQPVAVRHPEGEGIIVVLDPAIDYPATDVLVRTFPQFFAKVADAGRVIESVSVEKTTAAPGEKRTRSRK